MTPIAARDLKPGHRASLDPDGRGRVVHRVDKSVRRGQVRILWTDGSETGCAATGTLYLVSPEGVAA